MLDKISFPWAAKVNIGIFGCLILFHLVIIVGMLLFDYFPIYFLWGGRIQSEEQFLLLEGVAFITQIICLLLTLIRAGYLKLEKLTKVAHRSMWVLFALFTLNTVCNILAKTAFEKAFTFVTIVLALLSLRLTKGDIMGEEHQ